MIVYHADTLGHVCEGQILNLYPAKTPICHLYPAGVSSYGERAFLKPDNSEQASMQAIDVMFDYVRRLLFPEKPSRFTSVFASSSLEESRSWLERISQDFDKGTSGSSGPSSYRIFAVEPSKSYIADARFLDCGNELPGTQPALSDVLPFALAYWQSVQEIRNGQMPSAGRTYAAPELLLICPVRILHQVWP